MLSVPGPSLSVGRPGHTARENRDGRKPTPPAASTPAPSSTALSTSTLHVARKFWATGFVRGALFLVIGLLMFFVPDIALNLVKWLLIVLFALQAVLLAVESRTAVG